LNTPKLIAEEKYESYTLYRYTWIGQWGSFIVSSGDISYAGSFDFDRLSDSGAYSFTPKVTVSNQKEDVQKALEYFVTKFPNSAWAIMAKSKLQEL
jgi:hypothetical protein